MAPKGADMRKAAAKFFTASQFAVAGASSIPSKYGYKIFDWYIQEDLSAIPLNPTVPSITVESQEYTTVPSPFKLADPKTTSLSVVTPPPITAKVLQEAKEAGLLAVWLQPGSFTEKELEYAMENWPGAAVGGVANGTSGHEGWCVLVDGYTAMEAAKKLKTKENRQVSPNLGEAVIMANMRSTARRVSNPRPKRTDPVVGRKARIKKHVMDHVGRTENIRLRRILANMSRDTHWT